MKQRIRIRQEPTFSRERNWVVELDRRLWLTRTGFRVRSFSSERRAREAAELELAARDVGFAAMTATRAIAGATLGSYTVLTFGGGL